MKKLLTLLFLLFSLNFSAQCNLSVSIDSIVVNPCFRVTGGSCGCSNTLWAIVGGGTAPYTYTWTAGGNVWANTDTIHNACYELWTVQIEDAGGCIDSAKLNVIIPPIKDTTAGLQTYNTSNTKIYPNPTSNKLTINIPEPSTNIPIEIYDANGARVMERIISDNFTTLDVSAILQGDYFLRLKNSIIRISIIK